MKIREGKVGAQRASLRECLVGLSREAHHQVRSQAEVGDLCHGFFNELDIFPGPIPPVHGLQYVVIAALERHMQIGAEL